MSMNIEFREEQNFRKWWHYLFMILPFLFSSSITYLILNNIIKTNDGEKHPILLVIITVLSLLGGIWFFSMRLITLIDKDGIEVNYKAIPFAKRKITWGDIKQIDVVNYSPLLDYGGWGVRWSSDGWCYNVRGNCGIKIIYKNKDIFLIGTQKKEEAEKIINHYFNKPII